MTEYSPLATVPFGGGEVVGAVFVGGDAGQFPLGALGEGAVDVGAEGLLQAPVDGDVRRLCSEAAVTSPALTWELVSAAKAAGTPATPLRPMSC